MLSQYTSKFLRCNDIDINGEMRQLNLKNKEQIEILLGSVAVLKESTHAPPSKVS